MEFYDKKEKKTVGSSTLTKTGKMATSLFHPSPFLKWLYSCQLFPKDQKEKNSK